MGFQNKLDFKNIKIQPVNAAWLPEDTFLDVLRLDELHPVVSGNKWFKLKYYLEDAKQKGCGTIATFGGPYSNHIIAAAFACREYGFKSIGIIRGEKPASLSETLRHAKAYEMQLLFVSREDFRNRENLSLPGGGVYRIEEGGYGILGAKGAAEIPLLVPDYKKYTHIFCAVGTGTMLAGLINGSGPHQVVIGVSVLKNNFSVEQETEKLLNAVESRGRYNIQHGYHFGGYAKHPPQLMAYMRELWRNYGLPTDIVYTSKAFYGLEQMVINKLIECGSRVLFVHSGGLQGNASLQSNVLSF